MAWECHHSTLCLALAWPRQRSITHGRNAACLI